MGQERMILSGQSYHLKDLVRLGQAYHAESPYATTHDYEQDLVLDFLRRAMIYPHIEVAVLEIDGRARGAAISGIIPMYWSTRTRAHMEFLYIDPEYRGQGHAEQLIEHMIAWARKMEAAELTAGDLGLRPRLTERFLEEQGFSDPGVMMRVVL
jgi:GNAT superfamily N-acetyltransferase